MRKVLIVKMKSGRSRLVGTSATACSLKGVMAFDEFC